MAKGKRTKNDVQNIMQKTKDQATWTPLKTVGELQKGKQAVPAPLVAPVMLLLLQTR